MLSTAQAGMAELPVYRAISRVSVMETGLMVLFIPGDRNQAVAACVKV